jgi:hypothetical protein
MPKVWTKSEKKNIKVKPRITPLIASEILNDNPLYPSVVNTENECQRLRPPHSQDPCSSRLRPCPFIGDVEFVLRNKRNICTTSDILFAAADQELKVFWTGGLILPSLLVDRTSFYQQALGFELSHSIALQKPCRFDRRDSLPSPLANWTLCQLSVQ